MKKSEVTGPEARYVDRPEVCETYADGVEHMTFDGSALKLEFVAHRWDELKQGQRPKMRKYPACRLVLHPNGALDLYNKLRQLVAALEQSGAVKRDRPSGPPTTH